MSETTFSQQDVDRIIKERLSKERNKMLQEVAQREAELERKERAMNAKAFFAEKGYPSELVDLLDLSREDVLESASVILEGMNHKTHENGIGNVGGYERRAIPTSQEMNRNNYDHQIREAMGIRPSQR